MLKFFHGYRDGYFEGLQKKGLFKNEDGLKIVQCTFNDEKDKFNEIAKKGTKLYNLINENKIAFYVDRLLGGELYSKYEFSKELIEDYKELLSNWFLGFQIHEYGSVRLLDWNRINTQLKDTPKPWSEKQIFEAVKKVSHYKPVIHLSCGTAKEYSEMEFPVSVQDYYKDLSNFLAYRQNEIMELAVTCNASVLPLGIEKEKNVCSSMAEVGAQTPFARFQVAFLRGMSNALGNKWGVYYEPWGGKPFSTVFYRQDGPCEWRSEETQQLDITPFDFVKYGDKGGSSRSLQRRVFYYALFSGADYLSEEWGISNTFYDWKDYELTPYGMVKKEFLDFSRKFKKIKAVIPFAIVIPSYIKALTLDVCDNRGGYLFRELNESTSAYLSIINFLKILFGIYTEKNATNRDFVLEPLNENEIICNNDFGDVFDIIYDDLSDEVYGKYDYIVDFSNNIRFDFIKEKVIKEENLDLLLNIIKHKQFERFPFEIRGDQIHWICFEGDESLYLAIFNNNGVERTVLNGEIIDQNAASSFEIIFKDRIPQIVDFGGCKYEIRKNSLHITLNGGEIALIKIN